MPATNTTAGFTQPEQQDRSAAALGYQSYQMGLNATGAKLGRGFRTVPEASALFSNPPRATSMSKAQFGGGGGAKDTMNNNPEES